MSRKLGDRLCSHHYLVALSHFLVLCLATIFGFHLNRKAWTSRRFPNRVVNFKECDFRLRFHCYYYGGTIWFVNLIIQVERNQETLSRGFGQPATAPIMLAPGP